MGIFHKRINAQGAYITLLAGFVIGALRIGLELAKDSLTPGSILHSLGASNFLVFAAWFFLFCIALLIGTSLLYPAPPPEKTANLTFGTLSREERSRNRNSYNWKDIAVSVLIVVIVIGVMVAFNGR